MERRAPPSAAPASAGQRSHVAADNVDPDYVAGAVVLEQLVVVLVAQQVGKRPPLRFPRVRVVLDARPGRDRGPQGGLAARPRDAERDDLGVGGPGVVVQDRGEAPEDAAGLAGGDIGDPERQRASLEPFSAAVGGGGGGGGGGRAFPDGAPLRAVAVVDGAHGERDPLPVPRPRHEVDPAPFRQASYGDLDRRRHPELPGLGGGHDDAVAELDHRQAGVVPHPRARADAGVDAQAGQLELVAGELGDGRQGRRAVQLEHEPAVGRERERGLRRGVDDGEDPGRGNEVASRRGRGGRRGHGRRRRRRPRWGRGGGGGGGGGAAAGRRGRRRTGGRRDGHDGGSVERRAVCRCSRCGHRPLGQPHSRGGWGDRKMDR